MKAVHFGAGNIGRGFIGELLHNSGFAITFVEVNDELVKQLNAEKSYDVYLINEGYAKKTIDQVTALSPITQEAEVIREIVEADMITTSVWADNLPKIAPTLAKGLKARLAAGKGKVNVLACENAMFNTDILKKAMADCPVDINMSELEAIGCYPNTAVDRMVFDSVRDRKKAVDIGTDFELVIEQNKLLDPDSEPIKGGEYTDNLQKFLERKLYIINCGHAWAGYLGHLYGYDIIQDVFHNEELVKEVRKTMQESAGLLVKKYGFKAQELEDYIDFAIGRFKTPGITDTINRVSRSPIRKLAPADRLTGPCVQCEEFGCDNTNLLKGIAAALLFVDNAEDPQCVELKSYVESHGVAKAIETFTGIQPESKMFHVILSRYNELAAIKNIHRK